MKYNTNIISRLRDLNRKFQRLSLDTRFDILSPEHQTKYLHISSYRKFIVRNCLASNIQKEHIETYIDECYKFRFFPQKDVEIPYPF